MTLLFSSRAEVIRHWQGAFEQEPLCICHNEKELFSLLTHHRPHVVLLVEHRQYEEIEGFLALLFEDYAYVKTLLFSHKPSYAQGAPLLKFGIKAYANTYMAHCHIKEALAVAKRGDTWLYPEFIQMMIHELSQQTKPLHVKNEILQKLSEREREIAFLLKEGKGNKEIALHTGITERTVKAHISAIFEKTGFRDRLTLALML